MAPSTFKSAMDNGQERVQIPIEYKRKFLEACADITEKATIVTRRFG